MKDMNTTFHIFSKVSWFPFWYWFTEWHPPFFPFTVKLIPGLKKKTGLAFTTETSVNTLGLNAKLTLHPSDDFFAKLACPPFRRLLCKSYLRMQKKKKSLNSRTAFLLMLVPTSINDIWIALDMTEWLGRHDLTDDTSKQIFWPSQSTESTYHSLVEVYSTKLGSTN